MDTIHELHGQEAHSSTSSRSPAVQVVLQVYNKMYSYYISSCQRNSVLATHILLLWMIPHGHPETLHPPPKKNNTVYVQIQV